MDRGFWCSHSQSKLGKGNNETSLRKPGKSNAPARNAALDLKIFIYTISLSMEAGLGLLSSAQCFANIFSDNLVTQILQRQLPVNPISSPVSVEGWEQLKFENLLAALKAYPHQEGTFIGSILQTGETIGAPIGHLLREQARFIELPRKLPTTLTFQERIDLWRYLMICNRGFFGGLSLSQSWRFAAETVPPSRFVKKLSVLAAQGPQQLVGLKSLVTERSDVFLSTLFQTISFVQKTGGNLGEQFEILATLIRPAMR